MSEFRSAHKIFTGGCYASRNAKKQGVQQQQAAPSYHHARGLMAPPLARVNQMTAFTKNGTNSPCIKIIPLMAKELMRDFF